MATSGGTRKPCSKCNKGGATFTCDGCHRSFCLQHAADHRQELAQQMDNIGQQHDILKRDIDEQSINQILSTEIDRWEEESIEKIRSCALEVRADLKRLSEESKTRLNGLMSQLSNELRSNRENDEYTEGDLDRWVSELQELRQKLEKPSTIEIVEHTSAAFGLIKLTKRSEDGRNSIVLSQKEVRSVVEQFSEVAGPVILSNGGYIATCTSDENTKFASTTYCSVYGCLQYLDSIHHLRFRINESVKSSIFFGIVKSAQLIDDESSAVASAFGCWSRGRPSTASSCVSPYEKIKTQPNDEISLILDCPSKTLTYVHERTQMRCEVKVDPKSCPLPWKLAVTLWYPNDQVEILHS